MMRPHSNSFWQRKGKGQYVSISLLVIFLIGILLYSPTRTFFGGILGSGTTYLWSAERGVKDFVSGVVTGMRSKVALEEELKLLREENTMMQAQVLDRNLLSEEVARLEESFGRSKGDNRLYARVLGSASRSPYDTFLVDVGTDQGVMIGNRVVYTGSALVGEVVEVSSDFSKVQLYSSPGLLHDAIISPVKIPISAQGRGMGNFDASVPSGSIIHIGDAIVSAKGGYILGTVVEIERKPALPFARIFFRLPFNTSVVRSVEILKNI